MDRRDFARRISCVLPATWLGFVKQSEAGVVDLAKKSKAKREEENHIQIKILGFHGEKLGESKYFKEIMSWSCKYEVTRLDGSTVVRESPQVLSVRENGHPMRYQIDLS